MRNFKKIGAAAAVLAVLCVLLWAADFILYPCTFMRNDLHAVTTQSFDDVYVGTSHGKMNVDPETIEAETGRTGHNLCVGGEYPADVLYMTKLMIEKGRAPERLFYEISPGYFVREKEEGNNYLLFYHEFPVSAAKLAYFRATLTKCNFRTLFFPWYEYPLSYELQHVSETVSKKWSQDYSADSFITDSQQYHESGFIEKFPVDMSDPDWDDVDEWFPEDIIPKNMEDLKELISLCKEEGITFIAYTTPLPEEVLEECYEGNEALDEYYTAFFEENGVPYMNFNFGEYYEMSSHEIDDFTDLDGHMNGDAARTFSAVLAEAAEGLS